jgi:hypothetical protein
LAVAQGKIEAGQTLKKSTTAATMIGPIAIYAINFADRS